MRSIAVLSFIVVCFFGRSAGAQIPHRILESVQHATIADQPSSSREGPLERRRACDNSCRICHPADGRQPEPAHHLHPSGTSSLVVILANGPWVYVPGALGGDMFILKANGEIWGLARSGALWLAFTLPAGKIWCAFLTEGYFEPVAVTWDGEVWYTAADGNYFIGSFAAPPSSPVSVEPRSWGQLKEEFR